MGVRNNVEDSAAYGSEHGIPYGAIDVTEVTFLDGSWGEPDLEEFFRAFEAALFCGVVFAGDRRWRSHGSIKRHLCLFGFLLFVCVVAFLVFSCVFFGFVVCAWVKWVIYVWGLSGPKVGKVQSKG